MEFMSLDSVAITLRSDGMCFSSYASDTSTLVALPDTDLRVWSDLSTEDLHLMQEFLVCHCPQLMSWVDLVVDHLATELTIDRLMAHLLAGGSI
tara:strand:- start:13 stop:294 length:282 start_codon:yes stop_codon:yes gene_type:complete